jgi:hypothetical protein
VQAELHGLSDPPGVHVLAAHVVDELLGPLEDEDRDPGGRQRGGQRTAGDAGPDDGDGRLIRAHDPSSAGKGPKKPTIWRSRPSSARRP